jgi:hypothetical protein
MRLSPLVTWIPAVALLVYGCYYFLTFTLDDPSISFRYAENLARGHGLVFNPGERVEGYSNLLWVLGLSVVARLGIDPSHTWGLVLIAKLLGAACALACLPLLLRLSRQFDPDEGEHGWLRGLPALVLGVSVYFPLWSVSGLETPLFTLLLLLGGNLYLRGLDGSRRAFFAAVAALGGVGLTRPEGFFVAGAFAVHLLAFARRTGPSRRDRALWLETSLRATRGEVAQAAPPARRARWRDAGVAAAVLATGLLLMRARMDGLNPGLHFKPLHKGGTLVQTSYLEAARWLRQHVDPGDWVAVGEAGVIPYFASQPFIDLLALNDATLARLPSRFSTDYVLQRDPPWILLAGVRRGLERLESRYQYGEALLRDARFAARWRPCRSFGAAPESFTGYGQNFLLFARQDCDRPSDDAAALGR